MSRIALPRTPAHFLTWLHYTYASDAPVGIRCNEYGCPLALYLTALGARHPYVDETSYTTRRGERVRRLPPWASWLREGVDASGAAHSAITAAEVCALLQGPTP